MIKVKNVELQIWQGLSLGDDSEPIHSFERYKLISVCGGEIISVLVELSYFFVTWKYQQEWIYTIYWSIQ